MTTENVLPLPTSLATSNLPECSLIIFWQIASPKPLPSPAFFVVKKGSNILFLDSSVIPIPVSEIAISTHPPFHEDGADGRYRVLIFKEPP